MSVADETHVDRVSRLLDALVDEQLRTRRDHIATEILGLVEDEWQANDAFHRQVLEDNDDGYLHLPTLGDEVPV